jgi:hypothetical protein
MSRSRKPDDFESELIFHEREWRIQRIGWIVLSIFLALAFAGLFGGGPLSSAGVSDDAGALRVEYERFARHEATAVLRVLVPSQSAAADRLRLEIDTEYLKHVKVEWIVPQPEREEGVSRGVAYIFRMPAGGEINFHMTMSGFGRLSGRVTLDGRSSVRFSQFVYP